MTCAMQMPSGRPKPAVSQPACYHVGDMIPTNFVHPVIDTHAHLDEVDDPGISIQEARESGVIAIIAVGMGYESNHKILELAAKYPGFVFPALGLHPWEISKERPELDRSLGFIEDNLKECVALGEVGLDYDKRVLSLASKDVQQSILRDLLQIAKKLDFAVSLHSRYSGRDSLRLVQEALLQRVVFHWFTGSSGFLADVIASGYYVSATPAAEYNPEHSRSVGEAPLDRLLLETDCPVEYGKTNRYRSAPAHVRKTLAAVAELRRMGQDAIADQTTRNAISLFGLGVHARAIVSPDAIIGPIDNGSGGRQ
jgi:TatD DNase family protein